MKKILQAALTILLIQTFGIGSLSAYDAHHPDPMSFLNGSHHVRSRKAPEPEEDNATKVQTWRMYKQHKERKYVIKPEPYSLASKKVDPELLGPQRTFKKSVQAVSVASAAAGTVAKPAQVKMTRSACIALIGQEKFDHYIQKYGGEAGALHRCLILKRLRGN